MAPFCIKTFAVSLNFLIYSLSTLAGEQSCKEATIQITGEDGNDKVFKVKHLDPSEYRPSCSQCQQFNHYNSHPSLILGQPHKHALQVALPDSIPAVSFFIGELSSECDKLSREEIPYGLCSGDKRPHSTCSGKCKEEKDEDLQEKLVRYATAITDRGLVPASTGDKAIDSRLAYGVVLLNMGFHEDAINQFTALLRDKPSVIGAYQGRGAVYARKGLQFENNAYLAIEDFTTAISIDSQNPASYERRAEIYIPLGRYAEALMDINKAIKSKPTAKLYFLRATIGFITEDLDGAERDFRQAVEMNDGHKLEALYQLGLTLYYRGKVRNAVEVFKEVIGMKANHLEAHISLAQSYRELGLAQKGEDVFKKAVALDPEQALTLQLRGSFYFQQGQLPAAIRDFQSCLSLEPRNVVCEYMKGLSHITHGSFYEGVKSHTKVMINQQNTVNVQPEFIKAHYLREYGRYLHNHLDSSTEDLDPDDQMDAEFRDHWINLLPFSFKSEYREQPGLQPQISDVQIQIQPQFISDTHHMICHAKKVGELLQVDADGYMPNIRGTVAMGLGTLHIAQATENLWRELRNSRQNASSMGWRDVFNIAVQYRRLMSPEEPVFWLDRIPTEFLQQSLYSNTINFVRGHITNLRVGSYFNLVFKLVRTMMEHYKGEGVIDYPGFKEEVRKAKSCEELLKIAKRRKLNPPEFMVSTNVPSIKSKATMKHDGFLITLSEDVRGQPSFSVNLGAIHSRMTTYKSELDFIYSELKQEIKKSSNNKNMDTDRVVDLILSLVYYFHNLMPLSRGTSMVATSVAFGLLMSLGKEVTGKIPKGKLWEMEAFFSGGPDTFLVVTKNWLNIKKASVSLSSLSSVSDTLPTPRTIIEVLNAAPLINC